MQLCLSVRIFMQDMGLRNFAVAESSRLGYRTHFPASTRRGLAMIDKEAANSTPRAITARSLLFGLLGVLLMSGLAGYHDSRYGSPLMIGNHMPGGAFTYMMFVAVVWNGLAGRVHRSLALNPHELTVVLMMTLVACFPPTSGLFRYFHRMLTLPWHYLPGRPDWIEHGVLTRLNPDLFPSPAPHFVHGVLQSDEVVYQGMFTGLARGTKVLGLHQLPLTAWLPCLAYWGPLVFLVSLCVIALQFLVHQQWAHHEQLSYPVAQVAGSFCARSDGRRGVPDVFRNRLFWWGLVPVLLLYTVEFLSRKYPLDVPGLATILPNLKSWNVPLVAKVPVLKNVPDLWALSGQSLFFTIVGLAYFVSSEISLTMGLASIILAAVGLGYFYVVGTPLTGVDLEVGRAGSYLGYTLILLYTGRTYFRAVLARALLNRGAFDASSPAVLAARVLVLAFAGFVTVLWRMGCDFPVALCYGLTLIMLFFVFTRIICETGIPFMQAGWVPGRIMISLFGPAAIGPGPLALLMWVNVVLVQDPRECLMPYVATGVKVADDNGIKLRRAFAIIVGAVALALAVSFLSSSYTLYNFSAMSDGWASNSAVTIPFDHVARLFSEMKETQEFGAGEAATGIGKLALIRANPSDLRFFAAGILLVVGCSVLRFRFSRFPIHPVLFMLWNTYPSMQTWASFLLGWFVKTLIVRFGGGGVYQRLKPFFIGLISGELLSIGLHIVMNIAYHLCFGESSSVKVGILPG
jgi:hypothetical protein